MEDKYLVGLDEYKILNENDPVGYVRDISSCIAVLIHREKDSILMHIESYGKEIYLDNFLELLKPDPNNVIINIELFKGEHTYNGNLSMLYFIFHRFNIKYNVYDVFKNNSNETSVGYNFITKEHYIVRMDKGKPVMRKKKLN